MELGLTGKLGRVWVVVVVMVMVMLWGLDKSGTYTHWHYTLLPLHDVKSRQKVSYSGHNLTFSALLRW